MNRAKDATPTPARARILARLRERERKNATARTVEPITVAAALAFHWYDEIESGRKRVEYREITDYWTRLLWDNGRRENVRAIKFTRGYTQTKMTWAVRKITRDDDEGVFEIHLGKRIE